MDIRLIEFYNNLKNFDYDILGDYRVGQNEAKKIIEAIEQAREQEEAAGKGKK